MKYLLLLCFLMVCLSVDAQQQAQIDLELYATGFEEPVDIANAGDRRLFVVEKDGIIKIIDADEGLLDTPFLDIDSQVNSSARERGLLGLVFHPDYENNGYFYVNYIATDGTTHISRFSVSANPDIADVDSELIILTVAQPHANHNGGDLNFGADGYLYIGMGDGGFGGDPDNRAQNPQTLLGKMLRIDVDNPTSDMNYSIPSDNPFVGDSTALDEIWALGLRNPWRFSFDRQTGDMWIADVGQDNLEEIDFQLVASAGGENYGWRCYEGTAPFDTTDCPADSVFTPPIQTYQNNFSTGCSVTGGFVYRGTAEPDLVGRYLYADYCSGRFWTLTPDGAGAWTNANVGDFADEEFSTFGENKDGELYVAAYSEGEIYRITELCTSLEEVQALVTNESCEGSTDGAIDLMVVGGAPPLTYMWSTGATTEDLTGLAAGIYDVSVTDGNSCEAFMTAEVLTNTIWTPTLTASNLSACEGDTIILTASQAPENYAYQWYNINDETPINGATDSVLFLTEGNASYSVAYIGACASPESNEVSISFTENAPRPYINGVTSDFIADIFCAQIMQTLTSSEAPEAYTYQWYLDGMPIENATQMTLEINSQGTYTVVHIGECSSEQSYFLGLSAMTDAILPIIANDDNTLTVTTSGNDSYTYQWYLNGSPIEGATSATYEATASGIYTVELVEMMFECTEISPDFNFVYVSTEQIIGLNTFEASPIPVKYILNINIIANEKLDLTLQIQNIQGQILLKKEKTITGNWTDTFDMQHLPSGVYFLTVQSENDIMVKKVVK